MAPKAASGKEKLIDEEDEVRLERLCAIYLLANAYTHSRISDPAGSHFSRQLR
jgi:hypothetical protein